MLSAWLPLKQWAQFVTDPGKGQIRLARMFFGHGHHIAVIRQKSLMQAVEFPQQALESIARYSFADLA